MARKQSDVVSTQEVTAECDGQKYVGMMEILKGPGLTVRVRTSKGSKSTWYQGDTAVHVAQRLLCELAGEGKADLKR